MTKDELKRYRIYELEIESIKDSILELQTTLESVAAKPITDNLMNHNAFLVDKQSELILKKMDLEDNLMVHMKQLIEWHEAIEHAIEQIDDPLERAVLRMRYIDDMKWEEICVKIGYEWNKTHKVHRNALKSISKIN